VMEPRNEYSRGKPTVCTRWKAAVLGARWRVRRTPPGSESGACLHRGTRELGRAICLLDDMPGLGDRVTKGPGAVWALRSDSEPFGDTTNARSTQGIGDRATSEGPREGQVAVVASHSTVEGGEVRPKRPTGGKATSGRACSGPTHERDSALTNRVTRPPLHCGKGSRKLCLRNRMR
jgi:hypothetical protein